MVQGIDVVLFRPDDELKKLAQAGGRARRGRRARDGGVDEALAAVAAGRRRGVARRVGGSEGPVVQLLRRATGCTARTRSGSTTRDPAGASCATTSGACGRARTSTGRPRRSAPSATASPPSTARLLPDDEARAAFDEKLGLSRLVFPYVENHNFYIEHWSLSVFWRKMRELGEVLAGAGFWREAEDIFLCAATRCSR